MDFGESMICVVTHPIVDVVFGGLWVWFSGRNHTKWEGNITDRIAMTWNGLCWKSTGSAWHALAKVPFVSWEFGSSERCSH